MTLVVRANFYRTLQRNRPGDEAKLLLGLAWANVNLPRWVAHWCTARQAALLSATG